MSHHSLGLFNKTTEYGFRAMVYLASASADHHTARAISERTGVPERYLSKVLRMLVERGLVLSQRGPTGGFTLACDPSAVSLLDIVDAVAPIPRIEACPMRIGTHCHALCPLHSLLDSLAADAETMLARVDLASMQSQPVQPLGLTIGCREQGPSRPSIGSDRNGAH